MATELYGLDIPASVSPNATTIPQFAVVFPDASGSVGDVILTTDKTVLPLGVVQSVGGPPTVSTAAPDNTPNQSISVRASGMSKCIAGAAIATPGILLSANASGQVVAADAAGATDSYIVGYSWGTAAAAGDLITVMLSIGATVRVNA